MTHAEPVRSPVRMAWMVVMAFGLVSLFGDMVYEGGRASWGLFWPKLGATKTQVGLIFGVSELLGYGLRFAAGFLLSRTGAYWRFYIAGYALTFCLPLLGFIPAGTGEGAWLWAAAGLIWGERVGKALRSPAKSTLLSAATGRIGHGKGFGLAEAMDSLGAVAGPIVLSLGLGWAAGFRGYLILALPCTLLLVSAVWVWHRTHNVRELFGALEERKGAPAEAFAPTPAFTWYLAFTCLLNAGMIGWPLLTLRLTEAGAMSPAHVLTMYSGMMLVNAVMSLPVGLLFDRLGLRILLLPPLLAVGLMSLGLWVGPGQLVLAAGMVGVFGLYYAFDEVVSKAAVASLLPIRQRGRAYSVLYTATGLATLVSGAIMGLLFETIGYKAVVGYALVSQVAALGVALRLKRFPPASNDG